MGLFGKMSVNGYAQWGNGARSTHARYTEASRALYTWVDFITTCSSSSPDLGGQGSRGALLAAAYLRQDKAARDAQQQWELASAPVGVAKTVGHARPIIRRALIASSLYGIWQQQTMTQAFTAAAVLAALHGAPAPEVAPVWAMVTDHMTKADTYLSVLAQLDFYTDVESATGGKLDRYQQGLAMDAAAHAKDDAALNDLVPQVAPCLLWLLGEGARPA